MKIVFAFAAATAITMVMFAQELPPTLPAPGHYKLVTPDDAWQQYSDKQAAEIAKLKERIATIHDHEKANRAIVAWRMQSLPFLVFGVIALLILTQQIMFMRTRRVPRAPEEPKPQKQPRQPKQSKHEESGLTSLNLSAT